jgi:protein-S-isoprenylcysteine O-methyltransferase Ste14
MALIEEFESRGNWLFRNRSWIPLLLYIPAVLILLFDQNEWISFHNLYWSLGCLLISFLGIGVRAWTIGQTPKGTSGRNTSQGQVAEVLNTKGIYSIVRHPLYLGNFLMWLGIILYVGSTWFTIFTVFFFWIYYERIMFAEEGFLRKKFGDVYLKWSENVPPFFPAFGRYQAANLPYSFKNVLKREYSGFFATVLSFSLLNFIKYWSYEGEYLLDELWLYALPASFIIFISLRSLKKYTKVLHVQGR